MYAQLSCISHIQSLKRYCQAASGIYLDATLCARQASPSSHAPASRMCNMQCDRHPLYATMLGQPGRMHPRLARQAGCQGQRPRRSCRCSSRRRSLSEQGLHSKAGSTRVSQKHIPHNCRICPVERTVALLVGTLKPRQEQSTCFFFAK